MNNGMIVIKKTTWKSKLNVDYLDELSPEKQRQLLKKGEVKTIGEKLSQFNAYADKDNLGRVYVGGFFHQAVAENPDGTHTAPANLPKDEVKQRLLKIWKNHLLEEGAPRGIVQHRFVVSMSQEQHDLLVRNGLNPETFLHERVRLVMKEFREKFHAGDSIGYAYGLHHDTDNLHAHVAVCPRSEQQKYVGLSDQLKRKKTANGQKNQLSFIKKICERENHKLATAFFSFEGQQKLIQNLSQRRNASEYFYLNTEAPSLPSAANGDRKAYTELLAEHERVRQLDREVKARKSTVLDAVVSAVGFPRQPVRDVLGVALLLVRQLRTSRRSLLHSRQRYFHLHQTYYKPKLIKHYVNQRSQKTSQIQRRSHVQAPSL
jgi:hypothetical protein